jgi:hypothetical protein
MRAEIKARNDDEARTAKDPFEVAVAGEASDVFVVLVEVL